LYVPEAFSRNYQEIRSRASLLTNVAIIFWVALGITMLVVLMRKYREGTLRWRGGVIVGVVVAVVMVVTTLNGYPLLIFNYNTQMAFSAFIAIFLMSGLLGSVLQGGLVTLSGVTGGVVAQEVSAEKRNPLARFSLGSVRSVGFARATLVGYGLAFMHLGYVTLFYLLGNKYLGVWSPAYLTEYSNTYSTLLPWVYPLFVGLIASTMEEFFFRLLAISLLIQWTGKRWLAVLIPAVVWAFLHSNYPQEPIFIRGLELTVVGVIFGVVYLRYGIWATVISHYVYNAFQGAFPMVQSDSLYFQISGTLVVAAIFIPALPAIWGTLTGKYREVEEVEEEPEVPQPVPEEVIPKPVVVSKGATDYEFSTRDMIIAVVIGVVGVVCWTVFQTDGFGKSYTLKIDRQAAIQKADAVREGLELNVDGYMQTTYFGSSLGSQPHTHLVRLLGRDKAETWVQEETYSWLWHTRWFLEEQKEEIRISIDNEGRLGSFRHLLPENQDGANLSLEDAQKLAEDFVETHLNRQVTDATIYKLLASQSEKREKRTDHRFVWERYDKKVEEGEFRVEATVLGDEIGRARTRYKAPEAFLRTLNEQGMKTAAMMIVMTILVVATIVMGSIYLLRAYRQDDVNWRFGIGVGIFVTALFLFDRINGMTGFYKGYNTSQAMMTFWGMQAVGMLLGSVFLGLVAALIAALSDALFKQDLAEEMSLTSWLNVLRLKAGSATLWLQAFVVAVCYGIFDKSMDTFAGYVRYSTLLPYLDTKVRSPGGVNTYVPFFDVLFGTATAVVMTLLTFIAVLLIWRRVIGNVKYLVVVVGVALMVARSVSPADDFYHFSILFALALLHLSVLGFMILRIMRYNLLSYVCVIWVGLIFNGRNALEAALSFYQMGGAVMIVFGLLPLLMAFLVSRKTGDRVA
ncbi:MAG: CPBP family intramembrane metalloprotease, partial [Candidatus Latescibacteria bacterium]|nr:CPBP family intramembrane metalloprotease [Candidatus Latescibacterota bacterium]